MTRPPCLLLLALALCTSSLSSLGAEARTESNVIYGMYSGAALLMDIHHPGTPNGYGLIQIPGSAFQAPLAYAARPLKAASAAAHFGTARLVDAGYTVFTVNHRAAPRFRYPAAVEDVQRAVRFIRRHAHDYGIDPERIGATGGSSGGHLALMLGVLDGHGDKDDPDPVNRESAKVQTVATLFAPVDMVLEAKGVASGSGAAPTTWALGRRARHALAGPPVEATSKPSSIARRRPTPTYPPTTRRVSWCTATTIRPFRSSIPSSWSANSKRPASR